MIYTKIKDLIRRIVRASSFGILFRGTNRFKVPNSIRCQGKKYELGCPAEVGCQWVFRDIFLDDEYGLRNLDKLPKTIIDIGANVGFFSLYAGILFPHAIIHSYEPNSRLKDYLVSNLTSIGATVFEEGIGLQSGQGQFDDADESILGKCAACEGGRITITSLSKAITRIGGTCDLLKLDCEGCEWALINDAESFSRIQQVRMEYHILDPNHSVDQLVSKFEHMGFRLIRLQDSRTYGHAWFEKAFIAPTLAT